MNPDIIEDLSITLKLHTKILDDIVKGSSSKDLRWRLNMVTSMLQAINTRLFEDTTNE
jgi:hypothetical protein